MSCIVEITDFQAPELDVYARLTEAQLLNRHCLKDGLFIAESPLVIERALEAGCEPVSFLMERKHIENQAKHLIERCPDIPVYTAEFDLLTRLTGFQLTRGMLCAMRRPLLKRVDEVCADARRIAVLLTPACSNPLYRRSARVSMGTVFQIPWTYLGDNVSQWPQPGIWQLRDMGFKTAAMALCDDSVSIDDPRLAAEEKLAIVLGTEGDGLCQQTIADCDYTVRIPMSHGVDSLNVAAASAVAFWQLGRHD